MLPPTVRLGAAPPNLVSGTKLSRLTGCSGLRRNVLTNNAAFGTAAVKAAPARAAPAEAAPAAAPSNDRWEAARRAREAFEEAQAARAAAPGAAPGVEVGSGSEAGSARPAPAGAAAAAAAAAGVDEPAAAARPAVGRKEGQAAPASQDASISRPAKGSRAVGPDPAGAHAAAQGADEPGRVVRGAEPTAGSSEQDAGSVAARAAQTPEEKASKAASARERYLARKRKAPGVG